MRLSLLLAPLLLSACTCATPILYDTPPHNQRPRVGKPMPTDTITPGALEETPAPQAESTPPEDRTVLHDEELESTQPAPSPGSELKPGLGCAPGAFRNHAC